MRPQAHIAAMDDITADNLLPADSAGTHHGPKEALPKLMLGAIGVVYGDIGTSPLYAMKESFLGPHPLAVDRLHIFGVLSLIFWSMMLIVTVKYVFVAMRADNKGEGGSLALLALIARNLGRKKWTAGAGHARRARDLPVLRRRDDHAGDLGPVGGRGPDHRPGRPPAARHPDRDRHPDRPVRDPVARHGQGRQLCSARSCWSISPRSRCSASTNIARASGDPWQRSTRSGRSSSSPINPEARLPRAGLGGPRRDRRRGALCRHGPFRPQGDRLLLARRSSIRA